MAAELGIDARSLRTGPSWSFAESRFDAPRARCWCAVEPLVGAQVAELGVPRRPPLPHLDPGVDRLRHRVSAR